MAHTTPMGRCDEVGPSRRSVSSTVFVCAQRAVRARRDPRERGSVAPMIEGSERYGRDGIHVSVGRLHP